MLCEYSSKPLKCSDQAWIGEYACKQVYNTAKRGMWTEEGFHLEMQGCALIHIGRYVNGHITIERKICVSLGVKNESCERVKAMFSGWRYMSWVLISAISEHKKASIFFNQQICIKEWLSRAFFSLFLLEILVVIITDQSQFFLSQSDQTYALKKFYGVFCWWYSKKLFFSHFSWEIIT